MFSDEEVEAIEPGSLIEYRNKEYLVEKRPRKMKYRNREAPKTFWFEIEVTTACGKPEVIGVLDPEQVRLV